MNEDPESSLLPDDEPQPDIEYCREVFHERKLKRDFTPPTIKEPEKVKQEPEEGTKVNISKDTFPQIVPTKEAQEENLIVNLKRSDSALNIFDQTTILKLLSATNWTETFFNRVFRKKFLVISPDNETLIKLKNGFAFEQHISHKYLDLRTRDSLPAIASERDNKLTNGLLFCLSLACP